MIKKNTLSYRSIDQDYYYLHESLYCYKINKIKQFKYYVNKKIQSTFY